MLKSLIERPALLVSELGLPVLGVVLATIGFINFAGAFAADNLAFVGGVYFPCSWGLVPLGWPYCVAGHPRSAVGRATLVAVGWLGATYPLGGALAYLGNGAYIAAVPTAVAGVSLALFSIGKSGATSPSV